MTAFVFNRKFFTTMGLHGKTSDEIMDNDPPVSEVHRKDRKATDRRRSVKWVPIPVRITGESSAVIRERVAAARNIQVAR